VHDSRGIEIVNFTTAAALSAGTLMASAADGISRYSVPPSAGSLLPLQESMMKFYDFPWLELLR